MGTVGRCGRRERWLALRRRSPPPPPPTPSPPFSPIARLDRRCTPCKLAADALRHRIMLINPASGRVLRTIRERAGLYAMASPCAIKVFPHSSILCVADRPAPAPLRVNSSPPLPRPQPPPASPPPLPPQPCPLNLIPAVSPPSLRAWGHRRLEWRAALGLRGWVGWGCGGRELERTSRWGDGVDWGDWGGGIGGL